jgi:hypothetical protein
MKTVWVALSFGLLLAMVFFLFTVTGHALPVMTATPGIAMPAASAMETISIHMNPGNVPVVY